LHDPMSSPLHFRLLSHFVPSSPHYSLFAENASLALEHARESAKTWQTIEQEHYDFDQLNLRAEYYPKRLTDAVRAVVVTVLGGCLVFVALFWIAWIAWIATAFCCGLYLGQFFTKLVPKSLLQLYQYFNLCTLTPSLQEISEKEGEIEFHEIPGRILNSHGKF